jgi:hypothetical protein
MRTIICGGRDYHLYREHWQWLDILADAIPITTVLEGGAAGADIGARQWAETRNIAVETYDAQWATYGPAAGPMRNLDMVSKADALIAFPGGNGTADCTKKARAAGLSVVRWEDQDEVP